MAAGSKYVKVSYVYAKDKEMGLLLYRPEGSDNLIVSIGAHALALTPQEAAHMAAAILNSYGYDRVS